MPPWKAWLVGSLWMATLCPLAAWSQPTLELQLPERPREGVYVMDLAGMLSAPDRDAVSSMARETQAQKGIPILVVTVFSLAEFGAGGMSIEAFARTLFDRWGIGSADRGRNKGILLLIAKEDRAARIELGADWGHSLEGTVQIIMDDYLMASFRRGEFSQGIRAGVEALAAVAQAKTLPGAPRPWWFWYAWIGGGVLALFTAVSLIRSGSRGWAWVGWGVVFGLVGVILAALASSRRHRAFGGRRSSWGGGGSSGGGGGFSGGGGATGRW